MNRKFLFISSLCISILFFSCVSNRPVRQECSRNLLGKGIKNENELAEFFRSVNPSVSKNQIKEFAGLYIREAAVEGINSDVAFVQMCLETGFLRFGNLVVPQMHNYCGLGAMDAEHPGEWFETEQLGVRAHIQHLQAYATTADVPLKQELVDPRYSWVHKAKFAQTVYDLAKNWAMDPDYGVKLNVMLERLEEF